MQPLLLLIIFYVFFNSINASQPPAQDFEDKVDPVQEDDTPSSQLNGKLLLYNLRNSVYL